MFDLAWAEIALIGLVAVLVLGPKELPQAMRTMAKIIRKMRSLTSELQGHMNEIVREAELDEVRQSIHKLSATNLKAEVAKALDPTGEVTAALKAPLIDEQSPTASPLVDKQPAPPPDTIPSPAPPDAPTGSPEAPPESSVPAASEQPPDNTRASP
jgi:sec-independent protein translocase protein TatB